MKGAAGRLSRPEYHGSGPSIPFLTSSGVSFRQIPSALPSFYLSSPRKFATAATSQSSSTPAERTSVPSGYWKVPTNLRKALDDVEHKLGIKEIQDWHSVTLADLKELGFPHSIDRRRLTELLTEKYPQHDFERAFRLRGRYAQQKRLERTLKYVLFPDCEIVSNARKAGGIVNPQTNDYLELDVYIPSLNLAFEYHEKHHYTGAEFLHIPLSVLQERDRKKAELVKKAGITLVVVPCWWDGDHLSLASTIQRVRPDLLTHLSSTAAPIPDDMPADYLQKITPHIDGIGQPTNACFLTVTTTDPTNWWIFEKYDGVRGFWNPYKTAFYSRQGNIFDTIPQDVIDAMPTDIFLDGELWFGRSNFQESLKISNRMYASAIDWTKFKYMAYDVPNHNGTYEERYKSLEEKLSGINCKFIEVAPRQVCKDMSHLERFFQDVIDEGGEGIILRDPNALLQPGRSIGYLKHKKFRDAEARVIGEIGQYMWECELPNGIRFTAPAGTAEFSRRWDPQPGDIVTFKHRGFLLNSKKPKLPTLYRMRPELTWTDVVQNWKEGTNPSPESWPMQRVKGKHKPKGFWRVLENRRKFFLEFAEKMGFDPSQPANWRAVKTNQLARVMGTRGPIVHYNSSLRKTLKASFPELSFSTKERSSNRYWDDMQHCREFFDEFARRNNFNPLDPEGWYSVSVPAITADPGGSAICTKHRGLRAALLKAYPETEFKWNKEELIRPKRWQSGERCRAFFDSYAKDKGFDSLNPENWYSVPMKELFNREGGQSVARSNGGFKKALQLAYHQVTFERWQQEQG